MHKQLQAIAMIHLKILQYEFITPPRSVYQWAASFLPYSWCSFKNHHCVFVALLIPFHRKLSSQY